MTRLTPHATLPLRLFSHAHGDSVGRSRTWPDGDRRPLAHLDPHRNSCAHTSGRTQVFQVDPAGAAPRLCTEGTRQGRYFMKHWIIGLDPNERYKGAVDFARMWNDRAAGDQVPKLSALHVHTDRWHAYLSHAAVYEPALTRLARPAPPSFDDVRQALPTVDIKHVEADVIETTMEEAAAAAPDTGLIIGRKVNRHDVSAVRLGTVARRLVRRLAQPLVVVPPDWRWKADEPGPIVVATDLEASSVSAIHFAAKIAKSLSLPLTAVHVLPGLDRHIHEATDRKQLDEAREQLVAQAQEHIRRFLAEHSVEADRVVAVPGDAIQRLIEFAEDLKPSLIVCGSKRLTFAERIVQASAGSTLAASAPCPVAIVPPTDN
ncbi:MAG: universal stress protein [Myxococcales bacterium FL481]|nr:MAG: universal stress protein [Myxococcales bacterium FL481]